MEYGRRTTYTRGFYYTIGVFNTCNATYFVVI